MFLDVYGRYIMIYLYYSYGFGYVTNLQVRAPHVVFFHCSRSTSRSMADFPMGDGQRTIAGDWYTEIMQGIPCKMIPGANYIYTHIYIYIYISIYLYLYIYISI